MKKKYQEFGKVIINILLVTLSSPFLDSDLVFPHIGILCLLSTAERFGYNSCYINRSDCKLESYKLDGTNIFYTDDFDLDNIDTYKDFDIIGISCTTPQALIAYNIKEKVRNKYPNIKLIIGGPHAHHYTKECLDKKFDLICVGDGERIFESIITGGLIPPVPTVIYDELTVEEMNSYPIPCRQIEYISRYNYTLKDRTATTIVNSRGCPMKCGFCENRLTTCKWYSVSHFENQIKSILSLDINGIMIFDDIFAISPKRVKPYLEVLKKYNNFIFRCFGHAKIVAKFPNIIKMLSDAGCVEMGFGAESASQRILNNVDKGTKVEEMHKFVNSSIEGGINVKAFFMIGLPGETHSSVNKTYDFIKHYKKKYPNNFDFDLTVFFPYKGTKIGRMARASESKESVQLRLLPGYSWENIDSGDFGAYKKKMGESDIITETYDWGNKKVLLSAKEIYNIKNDIMALSSRYNKDAIIEGSI